MKSQYLSCRNSGALEYCLQGLFGSNLHPVGPRLRDGGTTACGARGLDRTPSVLKREADKRSVFIIVLEWCACILRPAFLSLAYLQKVHNYTMMVQWSAEAKNLDEH